MKTHTFTKRRNGTPNLEYFYLDTDEARNLRQNLKAKRFQEVDSFLNTQTDTNEKMYYLEAAADWNSTPVFLQSWFSTQSQPARTVAVIHRAKCAWNFSSWTYGSSDLSKFQSEIAACKEQFEHLANFDTKDASCYYWAIWIARALYQPELARKLFEESLARNPENKANAVNSLYTESGSWFGSPETLIEYTRSLVPRLPRTIGASSLLIEAHYLNAFGNESVWSMPDTRNDIIEANDCCLQEGFQGINGHRTRHWLAWGLTKIGEYQRAKPHFESLVGDPPAVPWGSMRFGLDRIFNNYRKARKQSLKN